MKHLLAVLVFCMFVVTLQRVANADAGSAAPPDAAVGSGSGSPAPAPHETVDDPTKDPGAYVDDVKAAKRHGWPLAILVAVYGVLIGLIRLGWVKKVSGIAAAVLAGAAAVIAPSLDAIAAGGSWWAAVAAAVGAGLLLLAPHKTEAA